MTTELITIENLKPLEVFGTDGGLDPIIEKIKEQVKGEVLDVSTEEGRARIASLARKIGSAKTRLEGMAMGLTEDWRSKTNAVNAEKKRMKEELDSLRDEIKAPLDEYRNREKLRVEAHETRLAAIVDGDLFEFPDPSADMIAERINLISDMYKRDWEEFAARAEQAHKTTIEKLESLHESRKKADAEKLELERLRKEKEERERKEHEERIAAEAAEKARQEAEQKAARDKEEAERKAKAEQERVEREKHEAEQRAAAEKQARIDAENKAKADAKAAAEKAEADKKAAIEKERAENEAKAKAEADAAAKREADTKHKAKINNEAMAAIAKIAGETPVKDNPAKRIVEAIAKGEIPHVKVVY